MDKNLIAQLSGEIQQKIEAQLEEGKMKRMQAFADEEQKIDTNGVLAFALSEAKLFTALYTTEFLLTLAEYEEMDQKLKNGALELTDSDSDEEAAEKTKTEE
ncbi:MAG: hypothetical protein HFJ84_07335 [Clostridiales bacterium]|nr:hypothetical protein [Clostridiales bacterium]